jgi:hypothetical protein
MRAVPRPWSTGDAASGSDPMHIIGCIACLWLPPDCFSLNQCLVVSTAWRSAALRKRGDQTVVTILSQVGTLSRIGRLTNDLVLQRALASFHMRVCELHLHSLSMITDAALVPLTRLLSLRTLGLTYCTGLTVACKHSLPRSVAELHVAGCRRMYPTLHKLEESGLLLDIHICERALQLVETHALCGFRFVDPALRAGVRKGPRCACKMTSGECSLIPDVLGDVRQPELWHASSFDWQCHSSDWQPELHSHSEGRVQLA